MSFQDFNSPIACKTLNTNESQTLGSFNLVNSYSGILELKHFVLGVNVVNMPDMNITCRLEMHLDPTGNSKIAQSDLFYFNKISASPIDWIGNIRFDFANLALNLNVNYYPRFIPVTYTRPLNGYIGLIYDWPISSTNIIDDNPLEHTAKMGVYFYSRQQ